MATRKFGRLLSDDEQDRFLGFLKEGLSIAHAAKELRVSAHSAYVTRDRIPAFKNKWEDARRFGRVSKGIEIEHALLKDITAPFSTEIKEIWKLCETTGLMVLSEKHITKKPVPSKDRVAVLARLEKSIWADLEQEADGNSDTWSLVMHQLLKMKMEANARPTGVAEPVTS